MSQPALLIYTGWDLLGDALLKLPAIRVLRKCFPNHQIHWLAGKEGSVFCNVLNPLVSDYFDEVNDYARSGISLTEVFFSQDKDRYDIVIDTQKNLKTSLILKKKYAPRLFISASAKYLLSDIVPENREKPPKSLPYYLTFLFNLASARSEQPDFALTLPSEYISRAECLLPANKTYVGFCPGAGGKKKCWPLESYIELANSLVSMGITPAFFLGPEERDWSTEIHKQLPTAEFPETALVDEIRPGPIWTMALATRMKISVANDSGGGHLLAAGGRDVVTLFSHYDPEKFSTDASNRIIISSKEYGSENVADIPVDRVFSVVTKCLSQ